MLKYWRLSKIKKRKRKHTGVHRGKRNVFATFISIVSIIVSVITLYFVKTENHRNEMLLQPRFTISNSKGDNGEIYWQLTNTGGTINNVDIYPIMYLDLYFFNTNNAVSSTVRLYLIDYFSDECYNYNVNDNTFYVNDYRQSDLQAFASQFKNVRYKNGFTYSDFSSQMCFVLNYDNYEGKNFNKVYTLTDNIVENNPNEIINYRANQLEDVGKIPSYDVCTPMVFNDVCVISANYKQAETQEYINSQEMYEAYLYLVVMNLAGGNDKSIDEMVGSSILTKDGGLYVREYEFGKQFSVEVKE